MRWLLDLAAYPLAIIYFGIAAIVTYMSVRGLRWLKQRSIPQEDSEQ